MNLVVNLSTPDLFVYGLLLLIWADTQQAQARGWWPRCLRIAGVAFFVLDLIHCF